MSKNCWMSGEQCKPRPDTTFSKIWSECALFAHGWLSKYWGFPGFSGFRPPLMNIPLDMWNIFWRAVKPQIKYWGLIWFCWFRYIIIDHSQLLSLLYLYHVQSSYCWYPNKHTVNISNNFIVFRSSHLLVYLYPFAHKMYVESIKMSASTYFKKITISYKHY